MEKQEDFRCKKEWMFKKDTFRILFQIKSRKFRFNKTENICDVTKNQ